MRLVIESDSIATAKMSGVGHLTLGLLRQFNVLAEKDKSFKVVAIVPFGKKELAKNYGLSNIKIKSLPPGYRYVNYALTRLPALFPVDLLYGKGVYLFPNYKNWPVAFSKSITMVHDVAYKKFPDTLNQKNLAYLSMNMPRWLHRTDAILTISKSSAMDIAVYFPQDKHKISTAYVGIDNDLYHPRKPKEYLVEIEKAGLPKKYILFVGNIEPRKNIVKLIEAYAQLSIALRREYALVIIGADGWKNEKIVAAINRATADGMNIIRPKAFVPDNVMPYVYNGAAVLVHTAFYEGFGMPLLEALASGTPVLCGNNSSLPEVVGEDALFFNETDASDIAKKIGIVLSDSNLSSKMISTGLVRAKKFSWKLMAEQVIAAGR